MKTLYLWVSDKGWTPFQYNELSELSSEFEARNIKLGYGCELGDGCELGYGCKRYTISEWQKHFRKIGEAEGYSPEQMEEYKGYIDLIAAMHKTWALH